MQEQNSKSVPKDSVLQLFAQFYGMERVATFKEVQKAFDSEEQGTGAFTALKRTFQRNQSQVKVDDYLPVLTTRPITEQSYLHLPAYTQRIRLVADMLLAEANVRAQSEGKQAFVHVVGLGLGVWQVSPKQKPVFASIFLDALVDMKPDHVSDVALSWIFEPTLVNGEWELPKEFEWRGKKAVDGKKVKFSKWSISSKTHHQLKMKAFFASESGARLDALKRAILFNSIITNSFLDRRHGNNSPHWSEGAI